MAKDIQQKQKKRKRKWTDIFSAPFAWFLVTVCIFTATSYAFGIFTEVDLFSSEQLAAPFFENYFLNNQLLVYHIFLAAPACVIGPFMFHAELRNNNLWWHRQLGKVYIICCMSSAACGFFLALGKAGNNPLAATGFSTLATLWFWTTWTAYRRVRHRDIKSHRRWLLRSFAMTFAFFTVKLWNVGLQLYTGLDFDVQMAIKSWIAWVPNLTVAEIYIRSTTHQGKWLGFFKNWNFHSYPSRSRSSLQPQPQPVKADR